MKTDKKIESIIRKVILEQVTPPGPDWNRVSEAKKDTKIADGCEVKQGSDGKWYYKTSTCRSTANTNTTNPITIPDGWKVVTLDMYNKLKELGKDIKQEAGKLWGKIVDLATIDNTSTSTSTSNWVPTDANIYDIESGTLIKQGMKGSVVSEIQKELIKHGYKNISKTLSTDGIFGKRTYNAVTEFQKSKGLKPDGIVGPKTWAELSKELPPPTPTPTPTPIPMPPTIDPSYPNISPDGIREIKNNMSKMKIKINEDEIKSILEMHSKMKNKNIIKEQVTENPPSYEQTIKGFIDSGCLAGGEIVSFKGPSAVYMIAVSRPSKQNPNKTVYYFANYKYGIVENGVFTWGATNYSCQSFIDKKKAQDAYNKKDVENSQGEGDWKTKEYLTSQGIPDESIDNPLMYVKKMVKDVALYQNRPNAGIVKGQNAKAQQVITDAEKNGAILKKDLSQSEIKNYYPRIVSPASEGYFTTDLVMYYPVKNINNAKVLTSFKAAKADATVESPKDCRDSIRNYFEAFRTDMPIPDNDLIPMKIKIQACKNQLYGKWGILTGGNKVDEYLDILSGKKTGNSSIPNITKKWAIK
jgi:peptidoglycan hydrolase-like protein with peptidoglycan-binding domain